MPKMGGGSDNLVKYCLVEIESIQCWLIVFLKPDGSRQYEQHLCSIVRAVNSSHTHYVSTTILDKSKFHFSFLFHHCALINPSTPSPSHILRTNCFELNSHVFHPRLWSPHAQVLVFRPQRGQSQSWFDSNPYPIVFTRFLTLSRVYKVHLAQSPVPFRRLPRH